MRSLMRGIRTLLTRARFERDMREELQAHIEHRADDLVAEGRPRPDALRQARLEFGALEAYKEQCRDAGGFAPFRLLHGFGLDLRVAAKRLAATPMFTVFAVLSLAFGVALTTAVYSVIDRIFWKDLGIVSPHEVVLVTDAGRRDPRVLSEPDFADLQAAQTSLAALAASEPVFPAVASPTITDRHPGEAVDGRYFGLLGAPTLLGRLIQTEDDEAGAAVVVLSEALWRTRFAAAPDIVGQTVRLSGRPFEIVGVAASPFEGPVPGPRGTRLWVPRRTAAWFAYGAAKSTVHDRDRRRLSVIGRLRPGITAERAGTELEAIGAGIEAQHPRRQGTQPNALTRRAWGTRSLTAFHAEGDMMRRFGLLVFGLIGLVLAVACTNLANLTLARGTMRQQEFAVRRALGASRWRLVREQSAESLILAGCGAVASWILLQGAIQLLDFEVPLGKAWNTVSVQPSVDGGALAVSFGALLISLFVFGLEPALQLTSRAEVRADLADGAGAVGIPKARRQRALLRWQVTVSAAFFVIASLCVRFLVAEARHDSGVELDRITLAPVDFYLQRRDEQQGRQEALRILAVLRQEPGIDAAAVSTGMPFGTTMTPTLLISTPDTPLTSSGRQEDAVLVIATTDYFRTTGTAILRGRAFDDRDDAGRTPAVILGESTARKVFGTADVVGRQMLVRVDTLSRGYGAEHPVKTATVVGVAEDTDTTHFFRTRGDVAYMPLLQEYFPLMTIVARGDDDRAVVRGLRTALRQAAPDLGVEYIASGHTALAGPFVFLRTASIIAVILGAATLLLAMVGLYGVQAHIVAYRTREIGVRMSLGATAAQIRRMVLKDGYKPVLQGLALGLFFGIAGRAVIRSLVNGRLEILDPWMLVLVPIPLLFAAFWACYLPARRASRVDPNVALRHL